MVGGGSKHTGQLFDAASKDRYAQLQIALEVAALFVAGTAAMSWHVDFHNPTKS